MAAQPPSWKRAAPGPPLGTQTLVGQDTLAPLPVPALPATLAGLRRSLQPLAHSPDEYATAARKIDKFEGGLAPVLQERLLRRQRETEHWLEEWWDNGGYLGYRDSVVVNVSYFYGFDAHPARYPQTPVARAAGLTRAALLFRRQYRRGQLSPERAKDGPLCMDTYRWMFDCCRVPGAGGLDWSVSHAKASDTGDSGHVIVLRRGRVWKVDAAKDGVLLSLGDLEKQFQHIYDNTTEEHPGIGVLTASNRDIWAKDYAELSSDTHNAAIIDAIHASAFIVCLDTAQPTSTEDFSRVLWHGGRGGTLLGNRWVDKPVQFIVCDNARGGIMGEHSVIDGTPTARMCDDVLDALADPAFDVGAPATSPPALPTPLDWRVSRTTAQAITQAQDAARELVDGQALRVFNTTYGRAAAKRFGFSPDAYVQMMVQLAYGRLLGGAVRRGATYEAASTRRFCKGRTEAVRVVSLESDAWVRSMDDARVDDAERRRLLQAAAKQQGLLARAAGSAQGIDRHLLGLKKVIAEGEEVPALYSDPLFVRSSRWVLSTSAIFSPHFEAYGWGEVVPDGFGVAYMTGFDDRFFFNITSRTEMPIDQFCKEIVRAATDMHDLFGPSTQTQKPRL